MNNRVMPKRTTDHDRIIGERIRKCRKHISISQTELGQAIGVSFQQVQKYENGQNRVPAARLSQIADRLGTTVPSLLNKTGPLVALPGMRREFMALQDQMSRLGAALGIEQ